MPAIFKRKQLAGMKRKSRSNQLHFDKYQLFNVNAGHVAREPWAGWI